MQPNDYRAKVIRYIKLLSERAQQRSSSVPFHVTTGSLHERPDLDYKFEKKKRRKRGWVMDEEEKMRTRSRKRTTPPPKVSTG